MSHQIGLDSIFLRQTPRLAHTEYCSNAALKRAVWAERNGTDPRLVDDGALERCFNDAWQLDFIWATKDGPRAWGELGRITDMGHADFLEGGTDRRPPAPSPFGDVEEVYAFDAEREYAQVGYDDEQLAAWYEARWQASQRANPNQVFPAGYYKTIVSGAIEAFGWELLLEAAADQSCFERVLDSFFRLTMRHYRAQARCSAEVFVCHDDMVWSGGPFMQPEFYRRVIFPRYAELWGVMKRAGKKVLFCSDGDFTQFVDDIVAAGADGLIFEPMTCLETVVSRYGDSHVIVGGKVDCRTLTFGTHAQIEAEVDATIQLAARCRGFMVAVGNHIPSNVPVENALFYYERLLRSWTRG